MAEGRTRTGFKGALAHRDFRYLLGSLTTSGIGDWFYNVALVVLVLEQTNSPTWVGAATIGRLVPYVLFGTIGGALADRYGHRRVMIAADLARGALMGLLALAAILSAPVAIVIAIASLSTAAGTPFFPAVAAVTPSVVDERSLAPANGLVSTIDSVSIAVGPALGGLLLLAVPAPEISFAVNALTFLASALFLTRIRSKDPVARRAEDEEEQPLRRQLAEGLRAMTSSGGLAAIVVLNVAATLIYGQEYVLYPLVSRDLLGTGEEGVGFLFAAIGLGGVLGASLTNRASDYPRPSIILTLGSLVAATPLVTLPFVQNPVIAYVLVGIEGASFVFVDVLSTTLLQRAVRPELAARAFGILASAAFAGTVTGAVLAPVIIGSFGLRVALFTAAGILAALTLMCAPKLRTLDGASEQMRRELGPRLERLGRLDIFTGMPRPALEALAAGVLEQSVGAGDIIIREGDEPDDLFVITSGTMDVLSSGEAGGAPVKVRTLTEGDYAGEIGLIERVPRTATVLAISDGTVYRIPGQLFLDAVNQSEAQSGALSARIAGRLARTHPSYTSSSPQSP